MDKVRFSGLVVVSLLLIVVGVAVIDRVGLVVGSLVTFAINLVVLTAYRNYTNPYRERL